MDPGITTYIQLPFHTQRTPSQPPSRYKDAGRPGIVVDRTWMSAEGGSLGVGLDWDPMMDWTSGWSNSFTQSGPYPTVTSTLPSNSLINDYPLIFPTNQEWSTLPPEINDEGIQPIPPPPPPYRPDEGGNGNGNGLRPLITRKPLLWSGPTWKVPGEVGGEGWPRERGRGRGKDGLGGMEGSLNSMGDDGFLHDPQWTSGVDLDLNSNSNLNSSSYEYIEGGGGGIVPLESIQPQDPIQFKLPSALTGTMGNVGGSQMGFGMDGGMGGFQMDMSASAGFVDDTPGVPGFRGFEAGGCGTNLQCPSHWGEENGGVLGTFSNLDTKIFVPEPGSAFDLTGVINKDHFIHSGRVQRGVQQTRWKHPKNRPGDSYQHGPIVSIPNSSTRYRPYARKSRSGVGKYDLYTAPTPLDLSGFSYVNGGMQEQIENTVVQGEPETMGYPVNEGFEVPLPLTNEGLGRCDSWNGGDIFDLISGTVPPVVANMNSNADAPSSPVDVPIEPREHTGIIFLPTLPTVPRLSASPDLGQDQKTSRTTASSAPESTSVLSRSHSSFRRSLTAVEDALKSARRNTLHQQPSTALFKFDRVECLAMYDAARQGLNSTLAAPSAETRPKSVVGSTAGLPGAGERDEMAAVSATHSEASTIGKDESETETDVSVEPKPSFELSTDESDTMRDKLKDLVQVWNGHALSKEEDAMVRSLWLDAGDRRNWHLQHRYAIPMVQNDHTIFLPGAAQCRCCAKTTAPLIPGAPDDPPLLKRKWPCLVGFEIHDGQLPATSKGCCLSCLLRKASCSLLKTPVTGISVTNGMPSLPTVVAAINQKAARGQKVTQRTAKTIASISTVKTRSSR